MKKSPSAPIQVRLLAEGTRVVILASSPQVGGVISRVRPQTNLKTYVVTCDDGTPIFASGHEVAAVTEPVTVGPTAPRE